MIYLTLEETEKLERYFLGPDHQKQIDKVREKIEEYIYTYQNEHLSEQEKYLLTECPFIFKPEMDIYVYSTRKTYPIIFYPRKIFRNLLPEKLWSEPEYLKLEEELKDLDTKELKIRENIQILNINYNRTDFLKLYPDALN